MAQGVSRRAYAKMWGVSETAIRKAIKAGWISPHPDCSVDIEASDAAWGERHLLRTEEVDLDPATVARIDATLAEHGPWLDRMLAEILGSTPRE